MPIQIYGDLRIWTLLFLLGLGTSLLGQSITVLDAETSAPLVAVEVFQPGGGSVITDEQGRADISGFSRTDSVWLQLLGYEPLTQAYAKLEAADFVVHLIPYFVSLDEIVVSFARWDRNASDFSHRVSQIDAREVRMQNPQTAADLLNLSGDVYIQKSQMGGGSPMIRGFSANRVLIAVDGVRMNNAIFRSGNLQNVISLDPQAIARTEVVFGPGSILYGSDAIGGVMRFFTLEPDFATGDKPSFRGNAMVRYASANAEKTAHADVQLGLRKWAFLSSVSYSDFSDLRMGRFGPEEFLRPEYVTTTPDGRDTVVANEDPLRQVRSGYSQLNLMQKIHFKPSNYWNIHYAFHYSTTSDVPRYDRLIEYRDGRLRDGEWYYGPQRWMMNQLRVSHTRRTLLYDNWEAIIAYQEFEESRINRSFGSSNRNHRIERVRGLTASWDASKTLAPRHKLCYGLDLLFNRVQSTAFGQHIRTGETFPINTRYPDGSEWNTEAFYLMYQYQLRPNATLQAGLRYNHFNLYSEFDPSFFNFPFSEARLAQGAVNGSLGFNYRPSEGWEFSAHASTGFRAPNIDDIGKVFDSEPGIVIVPNPNLRPEYVYSAELGLIRTLGDRIRLDAAVFYTYLDNALVRRPFDLGGQSEILYEGVLSQVEALQNGAYAWVWGIQAGVEVRLFAGLKLRSRINYQRGEEELDDGSRAALRHAAPTFGSTHLEYEWKRWEFQAYALYNGELPFERLALSERAKPHLYASDEEGRPYVPGWYTLNLRLSYQPSQWLQLHAGLENITDQRYRPYSSGITAPGRNLALSVRLYW